MGELDGIVVGKVVTESVFGCMEKVLTIKEGEEALDGRLCQHLFP
jgi:hypothetical protein